MKHTAGPWIWRWRGGHLTLETPDRGCLIVMDFVRKGMAGAVPRFALWDGEDRQPLGGIMNRADTLGMDVTEHPDGRLIALAPKMLEALKDTAAHLKNESDSLLGHHPGECCCHRCNLIRLIAEAEGRNG